MLHHLLLLCSKDGFRAIIDEFLIVGSNNIFTFAHWNCLVSAFVLAWSFLHGLGEVLFVWVHRLFIGWHLVWVILLFSYYFGNTFLSISQILVRFGIRVVNHSILLLDLTLIGLRVLDILNLLLPLLIGLWRYVAGVLFA